MSSKKYLDPQSLSNIGKNIYTISGKQHISRRKRDLENVAEDSFDNFLNKGWIDNGPQKVLFKHKKIGAKPINGYMVFIGLHDEEVGADRDLEDKNNFYWNEFFENYTPPAGSVWLAPRAPVDFPPLWGHSYDAEAILRIIKRAISYIEVNAENIYLIGFGKGGDGVCILASMLAPLLAGAASLSPSDFSLLINTYNLPMYIYDVEEEKDQSPAFCKYTRQLKEIRTMETKGYFMKIEEKNFALNKSPIVDDAIFEKLRKHIRVSLPLTIVWYIDRILISYSFYWLALLEDNIVAKAIILAVCFAPNSFRVCTTEITTIILRFNEDMIKKDEKVRIFFNEDLVYNDYIKDGDKIDKKKMKEFDDPQNLFIWEKLVKMK